MSRVKDFRNLCQNIFEDFVGEFLTQESTAMEKTPKNRLLSKLRGMFNNTSMTNAQIIVSQIKWYKSQYGDINIITNILKNEESFSDEDLQKTFDEFVYILENTDKKYEMWQLGSFSRIMNEENFEKAYKCLNSRFLKAMNEDEETRHEIINAAVDKESLELVMNSYNGELYKPGLLSNDKMIRYEDYSQRIVYPRKMLCQDYVGVLAYLLQSAKSTENFGVYEAAFNVIGDDIYTYLKYIEQDGILDCFCDSPKIDLSPEGFHKLYRYLIEENILSDYRLMEQKTGGELSYQLGERRIFSEINEVVKGKINWTPEEYENFFELCTSDGQINSEDLPIVCSLIKSKKDQKQNKECFTKFIENHKHDYAAWLMCGEDIPVMITQLYTSERGKVPFYTDNDIDVTAIIIDELIDRQKEQDVDWLDIKALGYGATSKVYKFGDYVIKIGNRRFRKEIANHRRILQPIIRLKNEKAFIEVCDAIDSGGGDRDAEEIFYEMLEDGIAWMDPKAENLGELRRKNVPRHNIQRSVKTEDGISIVDDEGVSDESATNMYGDLKGKPLEKGDLVIIDTDLVFDLRNPDSLEGVRFQKTMTPKMRAKFIEKAEEYRKLAENQQDKDDEEHEKE